MALDRFSGSQALLQRFACADIRTEPRGNQAKHLGTYILVSLAASAGCEKLWLLICCSSVWTCGVLNSV